MVFGWIARNLIGPKVLAGVLAATLIGASIAIGFLYWQLTESRRDSAQAAAQIAEQDSTINKLQADAALRDVLAKRQAKERQQLRTQFNDARSELEALRREAETTHPEYSACRDVAQPEPIRQRLRNLANDEDGDAAGASGVHDEDADTDVSSEDAR